MYQMHARITKLTPLHIQSEIDLNSLENHVERILVHSNNLNFSAVNSKISNYSFSVK